MSHILYLFALLCPLAAFAQDDTASDTPDTAEPTTEAPGDLLELPSDTIINLPGGQELELLASMRAFRLEPPDLAKGISVTPYGSYVLIRQADGAFKPHRLAEKYWLMPDSYYREAVTKAKQLDIYVDALDRCTTRSLAWQEKTEDAYDSCLTQFDSDEVLIANQVQSIATWETKALAYKDQRDNAHRQRNVAWAVTGGLILGASTVIVIAIAP